MAGVRRSASERIPVARIPAELLFLRVRHEYRLHGARDGHPSRPAARTRGPLGGHLCGRAPHRHYGPQPHLLVVQQEEAALEVDREDEDERVICGLDPND